MLNEEKKTYRPLYRCKLCGKEFCTGADVTEPKRTLVKYLIRLTTRGDITKTHDGNYIYKTEMHYCEGDDVGIGELLGFMRCSVNSEKKEKK